MAQRSGNGAGGSAPKRARMARGDDASMVDAGMPTPSPQPLLLAPDPTSGALLGLGMNMGMNMGMNPAGNTPKSEASTPNGSGGTLEAKQTMLPAFLSKTFEIFSMAEFATICGWNAAGDTIIVSHLEAFVAKVLPRFFKHRNFPSFVRQLNLYGFHKTVLDSKRLEFQHPYFKRDRPDLLHLIKRKVSSGGVGTTQQQSSTRLEGHRDVSDSLLKDMKELRQRSDAMEKRLRELEIDNAIVRSDNVKMWKQLETAKDKQLVMQEKMKKIMWILFQIYRGKRGVPKLGKLGNEGDDILSDEYINSSRLGGKEFRDVLHFLAMDEPPLLTRSSTAAVESGTLNGSRKRKFVEVPSDTLIEAFGPPPPSTQLCRVDSGTVLDLAEASAGDAALSSMATMPSLTLPDPQTNALSIFAPPMSVSRMLPSDVATTVASLPSDVSSILASDPMNTQGAIVEAIPSHLLPPAANVQLATAQDGQDALEFTEDELPLFAENDQVHFGGEEQHVMKKLADFETSLLDEYDVSCLDTLLDQLKEANLSERAMVSLPPSTDSDQLAVGNGQDLDQDEHQAQIHDVEEEQKDDQDQADSDSREDQDQL